MTFLGKRWCASLLLACVVVACLQFQPPHATADEAPLSSLLTRFPASGPTLAVQEATDTQSEPPAVSTPDSPPSSEKNGPPEKSAQPSDEELQSQPPETTQAAPPSTPKRRGMHWAVILVIVVLVLAAPAWLGNVIAMRLRMPDHAWKISLVLVTLAAGTAIVCFGWPPQLGPDLSGGINLIYEVDPEVKSFGREDMDKMVAALARRINPGGLKEVTIRPYGERQVEIIIPKADDAEVDLIKRTVSKQGLLEFRIVANPLVAEHRDIIALGQKVTGKYVRDREGVVTARWIGLDPTQFSEGRLAEFVTRVSRSGERQVLVMQDVYDVTGKYLDTATSGIDEQGRPSVNFTLRTVGGQLFAELTTKNAPTRGTGLERQLGIVLDDTLLSAPNLREPITGGRGQISGNFAQKEVDFLISILNAGSLPASLSKKPIQEMKMGATLGADTIRMSSQSMAVATAAIVIFMLVYYRFSGVVAVFALLVNMILLVAVMILLKAAFTLPGIAGLVLTVGMAVDTNVLIFERMREELARGAALRMAIRNGFSRATVTIVDSNLTTLITAIVLYWIGTDQIRGFAVTLTLGILMSMYAGVFCSRLVFDVVEKQRWVTRLKMLQILENPQLDFLSRSRLFIGISIVVMAIGMASVVLRGKDILDIDFTGGSSVIVAFVSPQNLNDVRQAVQGLGDSPPTVVSLEDKNTEFKIDTSIRDSEELQERLREIFGDKLRTIQMNFTPPTVTAVAGWGVANGRPEFQPIGYVEQDPPGADGQPGAPLSDQEPGKQDETKIPFAESVLTFTEGIKHDSLKSIIEDALQRIGIEDVPFMLDNPEREEGAGHAYSQWKLSIALPAPQVERVLQQVQQQVAGIAAFPASNSIGGMVAAATQTQAGIAMFASLFFTVLYLWLRFQGAVFGLAAVGAVAHDVIVTVGAVGLSKYLLDLTQMMGLPNWLQLEPFKINLTMVAALLTIVGYSLNDTIVIFDRIREIRGKSPEITNEMVNTSINQTLSRTLLTSLTTLIVVVILYFAGGPGIHGFAFSLCVGIFAGTYSTVFIACPMLLWMSRSAAANGKRAPRKGMVEKAAT